MMADLASAWELFGDSFVTGWAIAVVLAIAGVPVVARDQVFLGAAVAQASTLGVAVELALSAWVGSQAYGEPSELVDPALVAVLFSIAAALFAGRGSGRERESHEAVTGWIFLAASSLSILLVAWSPHGLEEVHRVLFSSIIGATPADSVTFTALAAVTIAAVALLQRRLLLFTIDPRMANAVGMRTRLWSLGTSAWLGLTLGLAIAVAGLIYGFGCLVLPALIAKNLVSRATAIFVVAPLVALGGTVLGFFAAHALDVPPAQMSIALLCAGLVVAWFVQARRRITPRRT